MSAEMLFLISLVLALVLGFLFKTNIGYFALTFAFVNGVFIYDMSVKKVAGLWPIYLFLMLFIVTAFYGFAISNGTLVKLAEKIIYSSRNRPALLPIVLFFICMMFAGTGAGAPATFAFLSPLVMTICIKSKISRVLATVLIFCGSTIGSQFPFSVGGIIIQQVAENSGFHNEGMAMCMNVLMNSLVTMSIFFVITYFVTGGHRTKKVEINKPEPFTAVQKRTLWIVGLVFLCTVIPAMLKVAMPDVATVKKVASFCDITVICTVGIILCSVCKVAKEKDAIAKVPFSIIIMICAMGTLIGTAVSGGLVSSLSLWVQVNVTSAAAPYILLAAACTMSFFVATLGVVIPTLALLVAPLATSTGVAPIILFSLISVGGFYTGSSPFSTCGAMALAGLEDQREADVLFKKLLFLPVAGLVWLEFCLYTGLLRNWIG